MAQPDLTLRDHLRILRRRKPIVILVPVLFGGASFALATLQAPTPLYRATASVAFERSVGMAALLGIVAFHPVGDVETQVGVIKGFPVLSAAARRLGLIPPEATTETIRGSPAHLRTIEALEERIEVKRLAATSLIEISATSPDPREAAQLANGIAEVFREYNLDVRNRQVREAKAFIEQELREADARLRQAEEALIAFKQARGVWFLPDEMRASVSRLAALEADHAAIGRAIQEVDGQIRLLEAGSALEPPTGVFPDAADPALSRLYAALAERLLDRENLLLTLRPAHSRVQAVDLQIGQLREQIGQLRERLRETLGSKLRASGTRAAELEKAIARQREEITALPETALELGRLEREVQVAERIFSLLKEKHQEALIKDKEQVAEVSLVRPAVTPSEPVNPPRPLPKAGVGFVLGLVVGLVLAFVAEALDTSIGAIDDVEALLDTRVLGVVPHVDVKAELPGDRRERAALDPETESKYRFLVSLFLPSSRAAEAFRALRTYLLFSGPERDLKTLMVTSAGQREGKTVVAINLAIALAQLRKKTLLVEADLRHPFLSRAFGIPKEPGLAEVLSGRARSDEAIRAFPDVLLAQGWLETLARRPRLDTFFVVPAGGEVSSPTDLLSSPKMAEFLAEVRRDYDYVVIDCAPILPVADAAVLGARVDGTLFVVRVGRVGRAALRRAKGFLEAARARIVGVCLTGMRAGVSPDYADLAYYREKVALREGSAAAGALLGLLTAAFRVTGTLALGLLAVAAGLWGASHTGLLRLPALPVELRFPALAPVQPALAPEPTERPRALPAAEPERATGSAGPKTPDALPEASEGGRDAPRAAAAPAEPAGPRYTVQLHTFRSRERADRAVAGYQERELPALAAPVDLDGKGRWWRVYVGRFATRVEAEAFGGELQRREGLGEFRVVRLEDSR